jgi:hypothetical protein
MYGLEKKSQQTFEFDLEKDLKSDPSKIREILKTADEKIQELKGALRQGAGSQDFDNFGVLLHGYAALQRVLNRIATKKPEKK